MQLERYQQIFLYENKHWWYRGRRKLLATICKSTLKNKNIKILDFGCGPGSTIKLLHTFGKVYGVDIEPQVVDYCKQKGMENIKIIENNKKLPFTSNSFDMITCMDVLEHIDREENTLNELKRLLKKDGLLVITVPAFPILWGKLDEHSHHLRRYTKKNFITILQKSGFKINKLTYFNYLFFFPIMAIRLFQRSFFGTSNNWGVDPIVKNTFINTIITIVFYIDVLSSLKLNPPFGVSLCAIVKKNN